VFCKPSVQTEGFTYAVVRRGPLRRVTPTASDRGLVCWFSRTHARSAADVRAPTEHHAGAIACRQDVGRIAIELRGLSPPSWTAALAGGRPGVFATGRNSHNYLGNMPAHPIQTAIARSPRQSVTTRHAATARSIASHPSSLGNDPSRPPLRSRRSSTDP
jgi:hypothetical protein